MVLLDVSKVRPSGPMKLIILNESKQGMIKPNFLMLNKVLFLLPKTKKWWYENGVDEPMEFLCTKVLTKNPY